MEKENKELRAKCVDNATLAKEAADLRVEVEAKEKELAATVEELRVLKEKEAKQGRGAGSGREGAARTAAAPCKT